MVYVLRVSHGVGVLYSVENDIKGAMKDLIQAIGWE